MTTQYIEEFNKVTKILKDLDSQLYAAELERDKIYEKIIDKICEEIDLYIKSDEFENFYLKNTSNGKNIDIKFLESKVDSNYYKYIQKIFFRFRDKEYPIYGKINLIQDPFDRKISCLYLRYRPSYSPFIISTPPFKKIEYIKEGYPILV